MKKNSKSTQQIASVTAILLLMIAFVTGDTQNGRLIVKPKSSSASGFQRKLLLHHGNSETGEVRTKRLWGNTCSNSDIVINQGPTSTLATGIPMYTVEIMNVCRTGCAISNIHVSCGWFSSARLVNPHLFKRLNYNDCLVNDGQPMVCGRTISFQYANTFRYPLSVSSVTCR